MGPGIRIRLGARRLGRVEPELGGESRCMERGRKWGIWLGEGGNGRCKWCEILGDHLRRDGSRNCAQDLREGRNERVILGKDSIKIPR